jgi:hypothetical protein
MIMMAIIFTFVTILVWTIVNKFGSPSKWIVMNSRVHSKAYSAPNNSTHTSQPSGEEAKTQSEERNAVPFVV